MLDTRPLDAWTTAAPGSGITGFGKAVGKQRENLPRRRDADGDSL
jgi:hypothetical protein